MPVFLLLNPIVEKTAIYLPEGALNLSPRNFRVENKTALGQAGDDLAIANLISPLSELLTSQ